VSDDEFRAQLLAGVDRLSSAMEGLLVVNTALLNSLTVVDGEQIETKRDPLSTMDG
jgi:hypothetical protein